LIFFIMINLSESTGLILFLFLAIIYYTVKSVVVMLFML
jgi:hypothetical protein